jgi:predicted CoA-binding protein
MSDARARFFAEQNKGKEILQCTNWAVVGDVLNPSKPAAQVVSSLKQHGRTVHLVNPRDDTGQCVAGVSDIGEPIDVVNLCINHVAGLKQIDQMVELGIKKVFIQPGAQSDAILQRCEENDIEVFQGCVMVEFGDH